MSASAKDVANRITGAIASCQTLHRQVFGKDAIDLACLRWVKQEDRRRDGDEQRRPGRTDDPDTLRYEAGLAKPNLSNWRDHWAGASRKLATPMPRGRRPSRAALTSAGAMKASEIVMLT